jgi:amino-acid N-acetyltransferase
MTAEVRNCDCVELRSASPDLPRVLSLLNGARLPTAGVEDGFSHYVVAESGEGVIGAAGLEVYGASALLRSVVVEDSWRGSGVGRRLIENALDEAKQRGIEDVFLLTTTAEHYFPRFGFSCVNRESAAAELQASVEFQGACPSTAVLMRKGLKTATG